MVMESFNRKLPRSEYSSDSMMNWPNPQSASRTVNLWLASLRMLSAGLCAWCSCGEDRGADGQREEGGKGSSASALRTGDGQMG